MNISDIVQQDKELFLYLNNLGSQPFDQFWLLISDKFIWIPLYVIFLYLFYKKFGWSNLIYILIFIALGLAISDQLSGIFKYGVARLRPCHDPSLEGKMREITCGGQYGFFSAHASNTFFFASFSSLLLRQKYRFLPLFLVSWAIVVAYSRIYIGVHFPLDVAFGAFIGLLVGTLMALLTKFTIKRRESRRVKLS